LKVEELVKKSPLKRSLSQIEVPKSRKEGGFQKIWKGKV